MSDSERTEFRLGDNHVDITRTRKKEPFSYPGLRLYKNTPVSALLQLRTPTLLSSIYLSAVHARELAGALMTIADLLDAPTEVEQERQADR